MTNITHDGAKMRIRVRDRAEGERIIKRLQASGDCTATYHSGRVSVYKAPQRLVRPAQVWQLGAALVVAACLALYAGSSHADECDSVTPIVLAKRPAMSFAPHHHRHRGPAVLRKREVGCTVESLPVAVAPLSVPAAEESTVPVVAEVIPPVVETPSGAIAAAAAGTPGAAVTIGVLVAGVAVCFAVGPCDGHSTTGGHSNSTAGTTGTTGK